jgi:signal peptidase I
MSRKASGAFGELWEIVKTLFWAAVIAIVIRTFAYEPFNIPSSSMVPTLLIGDYLFVSKAAYGYGRYSFPGDLVPVEGRIWEGEPKRGEVIVFRPPGEPETDFIKRLIGLPGDRVQVRQGRLYINDVVVERQRIEDYVNPDEPSSGPVPQYMETLPGGVTHRIIELAGDLGGNDDTPVFVVPAGHYFMMGDNRDESADSRFTLDEEGVGFLPRDYMVGRALIVFFSTDGSAEWIKPWTWFSAARWDRIGETY